jgi:cell division protein FtsZ
VSVADTVVTIPNDRLLDLSPKLPLDAAFHVIDELLMNSIKGIIEMVTKPALVNIDYNDLRTIMSGMGMAMVGIGQSDEREGRARLAVQRALESPLLAYDVSKAHGALVKVTGGPDMTLAEANTVVDMIQSKVNPGAKIIWGAAVEPEQEGRLTVMIVITGVESPDITGKTAFAKGAPAARGASDGRGPGELDSVR